MPHPRMSTIAVKRFRSVAVASVVVALIGATSACTATPAPEPSVEIAQYPPAPSFAPAEYFTADDGDTASGTSSIATLKADLLASGEDIELSKLLNASQGGYSATTNLHWLIGQSAQMSSMGLKEVRVDHVFDDSTYRAVQRDENGTLTYDFSRLDSVLLPLVENGVTPFIALSFMPKALGDKLYGPPDSMEEWGQAVGALVSHYRDLGYTGWSYEVWNEIDTNHWSGTIDDYNEMYVASANALKAADPTALVGGAAASGMNSAGNWSGQFIDFLGANPSVPVDYFSFHAYRADQWDEAQQARALLAAAGRTDLPIYVTEWNNVSIMTQGAGGGSDSNTGPSGPAYVAKRLFRSFESAADKFYYFTPVEGLEFHRPYNGDLGLITVDGHRKASGNVFEMYSQLESTLVPSTVTGAAAEAQDVYGFVTRDDKGTAVSAILWNNTDADSSMAVKLKGLTFGDSNIRVTQRNVNATQGNGFADGSTVVVPNYPSANENAPVVSDESLKPAKSFAADVVLPAKSVVSIDLAPTKHAVGAIARSAEPSKQNLAATEAGASAAASTSVEDAKLGWAQSRLTDGRRHSFEFSAQPNRGWSSVAHAEPTATESVQIDLGAPKPVDTVVLWPRDSQTHDGAGFPEDFTIQGSVDGTTWEPLYTATGYVTANAPTGEQTFEFTPAEYRYLKVEATVLTDGARTGTPEYSFQLQEIEAYRNGISNGGFESGTLDGWKTKGSVEVQSASTRDGARAAQLSGKKAQLSMLVTGLLPNTSYTFGAHARPETVDDAATLTVSEYGGKPASDTFTAPQWGAGWVTFTTGPEHTSAMLEFTKKGTGSVWADDFIVTQGETKKPAQPGATDEPAEG